ncbi:MAG: DNA circularization N-terminal domain-containing protein [Oscillospiraceae bacterium]|nr:DNA circularization N-terminal domain-containing protein [Oscillospiraceae bacterium]
MAHLRYRTFVWPQNPEVYQENASREAQYHTKDGVTYFDGMGQMRRIITGKGCFVGEQAFQKFKELLLLMEDGTMGDLEHPVWGIRNCYFTGLELLQEPKDNFVSYQFAFTQALDNGVVPE